MIWPHVSKQNPCPICEKTDWCQIGDRSIKCYRIQSDHPSKDGGWYHFKFTGELRPLRVPLAPKPTPSGLNFESMLFKFRAETSETALSSFCNRLGLTVESMRELGASWSRHYCAWAFPMRDGSGRIVGIRLRSEDGRKWAIPGSTQGMFYSPVLPEKIDTIAICEGPTTTAAAMDLGFFAMGRPNCHGQADQVRILMRRLKINRALIIADYDVKVRPDGTVWNPGLEGANRLGRELGRRHLVWSVNKTENIKDLRDYKKAGGTLQMIMDEIKNMMWG